MRPNIRWPAAVATRIRLFRREDAIMVVSRLLMIQNAKSTFFFTFTHDLPREFDFEIPGVSLATLIGCGILSDLNYQECPAGFDSLH